MATSDELNQLFIATSNLQNLGAHHQQAASGLKAQGAVLGNTTEQLVAGYELYGLENDLEAESLALAELPGVTEEPGNLSPADPKKLQPQPRLGETLEERKAHFGHHPPVVGSADGLAAIAADSQSILPWTPHPQHSYKDNSTRVVNRTGRKRPRPSA